MNYFFFNLILLYSIMVFTKNNNISFWDLVLELSNQKRIILFVATLILPISLGLFYSFISSSEMFTWYFIIFLMVLAVGVYYLISNITELIILNFFTRKESIQNPFKFKKSFLIEAGLFLIVVFLFKENERSFWVLFYCIPFFRILFYFFRIRQTYVS